MNITFKGTFLFLFLVLLLMGTNNRAFAQQDCQQLPDASLANPKYNFTFCSFNTSTATFNMVVENKSTTKATNASYHIAWGDGTSSTLGKDFTTTTHTYRSTGLFNLVLTVTGEDGCTSTRTQEVFVGSNPGIGISREGNSSDCAPISYTFRFNSFENNSPYTTYRIKVDDGSPVITRTHQEMLANPYFDHTFNESSQDLPEGFTLEVLAINPCFTTRNAWTGIRISKGPIAKIGAASTIGCVNQPFKLKDNSTSGYDAFSNTSTHKRVWEITPATGWTITEGNATYPTPTIVFTQPGDYKIKLTVSPEDENSNCLSSSAEEEIHITTPPTAGFSLNQSPVNGCGPNTVTVRNTSEGENINFNWTVTKTDGSAATGWSFVNGTAGSKEPQFRFETPGSYIIGLTASNGCAPNSTVSDTVTIIGTPTVSLPAAPAPYCGPTTVAFTAENAAHKPVYNANFGTITGYKWEVKKISGQGEYSFETGNSSAANPGIRFTTAGNTESVFEVAVTATNECGETSPAATQRITILPIPVVSITAPKPAICIGESITLTASGATAFTWAAADGLSATTGNKVTVKPTKTTTYTVTGKNNETGCSTTAQFTVVVNPLPTVAISTSAPEICVGQGSATLTASGATTYTWAPATGLSATTGTSVTASPATTTTYTVTGFDAETGCSNTATVTVKVNPLPQVNAGEDMLVCDNPTPIKLNGSPAGGTWSGPHVSADGYFTPAGKGSFVVRYTYTNAAGCFNVDDLTVNVSEALVADAGADKEVCLNSGSFALAGNPVGGTWSGSQHVTKDGTFSPTVAGTYNLTYTYYTGTCSTTDQVQVTVKPLPAIPVVRATTICYGATATLTAENPAGTVVWFDKDGKELHRGTSFPTAALMATTKFYAETLGENGCSSPRTEVQVVVRPQTPAPMVDAVTLCGPGVATLNAQGTAETYNWYNAGGQLQFTGKTFKPEVANNTTFYAEGVIAGCAGPRTPVQVTVLPVLANNTIKEIQTICFGQKPATLTGTQPEGGNGTYSYRWESSLTEGTGFTTIDGATEATYAPQALERTTWFRRVVTSGTCTDVSPAIKVTVTPLVTKNTIGSNRTICVNSPAGELTGSEPEGGNGTYTYVWESSTSGTVESFTAADGDNTKQNFNPGTLGQTTWFRRVVKSGTCDVSISEVVKVTVVTPVANNTLTNNPIVCGGNTPVTLAGTQPTGGDGDYKFRWEVSTDGVTYAVAPGVNNAATYTPSEYNQILWYRRVVTAGPCEASVSNAVQVLPDVSNNIISNEKTICFGDGFETLTGTAPKGGDGKYTYLWLSSKSAEGNFTPAAGDNTQPDYTAPAPLTETTWFRRVVTSGPCGESRSNSIKITVQPAIASNTLSAEELTVCAGSAPASLKGAQPTGGNNTYTYVWESSTDGVNFAQAEGTATGINYQPAKLDKTTWFRRNVYSGQCASVSEVIKITVNPVITSNVVAGDQEICTGTVPAKLTGTQPAGSVGNFTYQWQSSASGKNGPFTNIANATQADYAPAGLTTTTWYRRVVTSGACVDFSNVVAVTVSPVIARNTIALAQEIYKGQTPAALTGSSPIGGNNTYAYLWESSTEGADKGFAPAAGVNNEQHYAPGALQQNTWYRRRVISGGCENTSAAIAITVIPDIVNNTIQAGQSICYGNKPAPLTGTQPAGGEGKYVYLWQSSTKGAAEGFMTAAGQNNGQNYSPAALTQSTWFRRVVVSGPFKDTSEVVLIKVNPAMANNTVSTNQTICFGTAAAQLTGSKPTGGSGAYTYLWESSTTGPDKGFTSAAGTNSLSDYTPVNLTQTTWYRRVVTSESCDRLVSNVVAVTVNPLPAAPVVADVTICYGNRTILKATGSGGKLLWYTSATGGTPVTGSEFTTPVLTQTTTFYVEEVAASCPGPRKAVTVTVSPQSAYAGEDVTIIKGRSTTLTATGGVSYSWSPAAGLYNAESDKILVKPEVTTTYTVTVTTAAGCVSTDEVTVTVLPLVDVPNTFTPNRDGINDTWVIKNLDLYPQCKVQVFNQWGNMVYSSLGYKAPWDGRQNGQELPIATYYYVIHLGNSEKPLSGSVTIVK
ncbi:Ig-like domain-containing protein [Botryobacter ruber]|uniref:Ig-like domain-containing protein n=1 Tax=Botryobacter ruber TaxID=2171629 RepID=UPI000E0AE635|nr:gliding motility-associated C-terminal domain-containing protein [Botryobacter ruber]